MFLIGCFNVGFQLKFVSIDIPIPNNDKSVAFSIFIPLDEISMGAF